MGRRCLDDKNITGSTSTYYVHKHKTLTTKDDYILDKVGFENLLFEDERKIIFENPLGENDMIVERNRQESVLFDFKKTFKLTDIKNNLGYTPTEVYVSFIFKNGNGLFDYPPKVGFKFNFHDTWIDQSFSGTTKTTYPYEFSMSTGTTFKGNKYTDLGVNYNYTGVTFTGGTFLPLGTSGLTGAFVEYNIKEIKERIISESYHRFSHVKSISGVTIFDHNQDNSNNTRPKYSGASINNTVGYYYQPHHRIKLRQLSPYIESSKTKEIINLPENVIFDDKEYLWKWRDLYDHGFIDQEGNGTNFPFINNTHYVVNDINFYLRNEIAYTNKNDLFSGFNNYKNKTNC